MNTSISSGHYFCMGTAEDICSFLQLKKYIARGTCLSVSEALATLSKFFNSKYTTPFLFERQIGRFDTLLVCNSVKPRYVVFMFHAQMGNPANMTRIARTFCTLASANNLGVCCVIPYGPHSDINKQDTGNAPYTWWKRGVDDRPTTPTRKNPIKTLKDKGMKKINSMKEGRSMSKGGFNLLCEPEGSVNTIKLVSRVQRLVNDVTVSLNVPAHCYGLLGFGQGASLCMHLLYQLTIPPMCTVLLSAADVSPATSFDNIYEEMSAKRRKQFAETKVFMSHGQSDYIMPYEGALRIKKKLEKHNCRVCFSAHADGFSTPEKILFESMDFFMSSFKPSVTKPLLNPVIPPAMAPNTNDMAHELTMSRTNCVINEKDILYDSTGGYNPMINASAEMKQTLNPETSIWNISGFTTDVMPFDLTGVGLKETVIMDPARENSSESTEDKESEKMI